MREQTESGEVRHAFEPLVLFATLLMIPVIIIQRDASSHTWQNVATVANWVIWAVFAAEMAFILVAAPRKLAARNPLEPGCLPRTLNDPVHAAGSSRVRS